MSRNHYKSERIQKLLPKIEDKQVKYTGMNRINKHFLIAGGTGSGKTNTLYDYIIQTSRDGGTFQHIFLCYKTDEPLYDDLKEQLADQISCYKSVADLPSVDEFPDLNDVVKALKDQGKKKMDIPQYLLILDDCINDKDKASTDKINKYFTYGRKKGFTLAFLSQSYYRTNIFVREQVSYLLLQNTGGKRALNALLTNAVPDCDPDVLLRIFKRATARTCDEEIPFLKIDLTTIDTRKKFSKCWLDYIPYDSITDDQTETHDDSSHEKA